MAFDTRLFTKFLGGVIVKPKITKADTNDQGVPVIPVRLSVQGGIVGTGPLTVDTTATGVSLPAAEVVNGIYAHSPTGACNDQMDTAAALVALIPDCAVGAQFEFYLRNKSAGANTITLTTNTGITLDGTMTVAQSNTRFFVGVVTNATAGSEAVTIYSMGSQAH